MGENKMREKKTIKLHWRKGKNAQSRKKCRAAQPDWSKMFALQILIG